MKINMNYKESLKVLSVGNSFSDDGMAYLYQIANDYGIKNIVIGILYIGGCDLERHAVNISLNNNSYVYRKNTTGEFISEENKTILDGLLDEDWDIITIHQASYNSGIPSSYEPHLSDLIKYVNLNKTNKNAKLYWQMTWAYQSDSDHPNFPSYDNDQLRMYKNIVSTYQSTIMVHPEIDGLIPAGTAIQNVRTSFIKDTITHDGYHLNNSVGRYTASMTWFKAITGLDLFKINYRAEGVSKKDRKAVIEAVNKAILNPFEITKSVF